MAPVLAWKMIVPLGCLAFTAGLLAGTTMSVPLMVSAGTALLLGGAGAWLATRSRRWASALCVLFLAAGLGALRGATAAANPLDPWNPGTRRIELLGTVDEPPETKGGIALVMLRIETVEDPEVSAVPAGGGLVQLVIDPLPPFGLGDPLRVVGRFDGVDPDSPNERWLLRRGVVAVSRFPEIDRLDRPGAASPWSRLLPGIRASLEWALQRMLPEPNAGLMAGLLVGATSGYSEPLRQAFVASGTSHLVVVSGYNISLVAAALAGLFRGRRWLGAFGPFAGLWLFTLVAGAGPPSVRAAIMSTAAVAAMRLGRGVDPLGALAITSAAMLAWSPGLAQELGFQLSVLATLGLVTLQPRVDSLLGWAPRVVREPLGGTIAAQLATVPVLATSFHQISIVAPLSNALAAPAVPIATIGSGLLAPLVAVVPALAPLGGLILAIPSTYLLTVITWTAGLPQAILPVAGLPLGLAAVYGVALLVWAILPTPEGRDVLARLRATPRLATALVALPIGSLLGSALGAEIAAPSPGFTATIFDAGSSPALFARTPGGHTILIDGGHSASQVTAELASQLGLTERQLSLAVLTRLDGDHIPGLLVALERYPPVLAVAPSDVPPSSLSVRWGAATAGRLQSVHAPTTLVIEPGCQLDLVPTPPVASVIAPTHPQPTLAVRLACADASLLFAPTATAQTLSTLAAQGTDFQADVLLVPRGGAADSLDPVLLNLVRPRLAVLAPDPRARSGPSDAALGLLAGIPTLRTDLYGSIELSTVAGQLRVRTERLQNTRLAE